MAEIRQDIAMKVYGGLNVADQEDQLVMRNFQQTQAGFSQTYPVESPMMVNIDYTKTGIKKRNGSTADRDLSGVTVAGEQLLDGVEFVAAADGTRYEIMVGVKSIYVSSGGGAFAQINASSGTAYVHASDVSMLSFAQIAGHLFIGLDSTNEMQVFRTGTGLDPAFANGNNFIEAYDTTAVNAINNVIPTGAYMVEAMQERLIYSNGDTLIYISYTAYGDGLWDSPATNFFTTAGNVRSLNAFTPEFTDSLSQVLYAGHDQGFDVIADVDVSTGYPYRIKGSKAPLNNRSVCASKNWLMYLTRQKNLYAINKTSVINIGRRLKNDINGPLDDMNLTVSNNTAFGFYSNDKEQAYFFYADDTDTKNNRCAVVDMKLGEPIPGEPLFQFETHVRMIDWKLRYGFDDTEAPVLSYWFTGMYSVSGDILGVYTDSSATVLKTYSYLSGDDDLDTAAVVGVWKAPVFLGAAEEDSKQWMTLTTRVLPKGSHYLTVELFENRSDYYSSSFTFEQYDSLYAVWGTAIWGTDVWASSQVIKNIKDIDLYSDALQWAYSNTGVAQPFEISGCALRYMTGAEER